MSAIPIPFLPSILPVHIRVPIGPHRHNLRNIHNPKTIPSISHFHPLHSSQSQFPPLEFSGNPNRALPCPPRPSRSKISCWMDTMEDIFGSSLKLEETHFKEGYDEGYADGLISGKEEGQQVGLKTGFEVGEELGFYSGCVDVWSSAIRVDPNFVSARIQRTIKQMDDLLQKYPISEPENESVSDMMDSLRLKFRAICASLNVKLEYSGYPKASDAGTIEF